MEQLGTILETSGGRARVLVRRPGACEHCGACELGSRPEQVVDLPNPAGLPVGASVRLVVAPGEVAKASLVVYVIPLLALLLGFGVGEWFGRWTGRGSELLILLVGVLFLFASYGLIFLWDRRRQHSRCTPAMELAPGGERTSGEV